MSVNFRHGGYVHFRGIRANLNFGKKKLNELMSQNHTP